MTTSFDAMSLDELRRHVLTHREDIEAFQTYIDRSKAVGLMVSIDLNDPDWEENLTDRIRQMTSAEGESNQS